MLITSHAYIRAKERLGIELTPLIIRQILHNAKKKDFRPNTSGEGYLLFCTVENKKLAMILTKELVIKTVFAVESESYATWAERIKYGGR
jgi:hypothetical protein